MKKIIALSLLSITSAHCMIDQETVSAHWDGTTTFSTIQRHCFNQDFSALQKYLAENDRDIKYSEKPASIHKIFYADQRIPVRLIIENIENNLNLFGDEEAASNETNLIVSCFKRLLQNKHMTAKLINQTLDEMTCLDSIIDRVAYFLSIKPYLAHIYNERIIHLLLILASELIKHNAECKRFQDSLTDLQQKNIADYQEETSFAAYHWTGKLRKLYHELLTVIYQRQALEKLDKSPKQV